MLKVVHDEIVDKSGLKDDELVERILAGDDDAFEVLVKRHSRAIFDISGRFFRQRDIREDITQETFIKAYQRLHTYRCGASFRRWLMRVSINTCYDELRRLRRRQEFNLADITDNEAAWLEEAFSKPAMELFEEKQRSEQAAALAERLLQTLPPKDVMIVLLYERDGLSTAEIAELTGWSRSKVKVRLFRARRTLDKRIRSMVDSLRKRKE